MSQTDVLKKDIKNICGESYNKYSHEDTEILIEIEAKVCGEIWDPQ